MLNRIDRLGGGKLYWLGNLGMWVSRRNEAFRLKLGNVVHMYIGEEKRRTFLQTIIDYLFVVSLKLDTFLATNLGI